MKGKRHRDKERAGEKRKRQRIKEIDREDMRGKHIICEHTRLNLVTMVSVNSNEGIERETEIQRKREKERELYIKIL